MITEEQLENLLEIFDHWKDLPEIARKSSVPYYVQDGIDAVWDEIRKFKNVHPCQCGTEQTKFYCCHGGHYLCQKCFIYHREKTLRKLEEFYKYYNIASVGRSR